jgi:hypothetical protein
VKTTSLSNKDCMNQFNTANSVSESERLAVLRLFHESGDRNVADLLDRYVASMNQDLNSDWLTRKPSPPEIVKAKLPPRADEAVDIIGIGGMFSYLNILYQVHKNGGNHCIVTNPHDIFTFSGWTVHPEEDMDQRLIAMFRTRSLIVNEVKRLLGLSEPPQSIRYKAFKIDYGSMLAMAARNPQELMRNIKVALHYSVLEFIDTQKRYAKTNLERNGATLLALSEMGLIGDNPRRHVANLCSRLVFEIEGEARIEWKKRLKEEFGIIERRLIPSEVEAIYGDCTGIIDEMKADRIKAVLYPGGQFVTGHRSNALNAARERNVLVYDNAVASKITVDIEAGKHAVTIKLADGTEKLIIADVLLLALGDFGKSIISVDGVSTLFAVITDNSSYKIHPTGMGEGGTIHVVPVSSLDRSSNGKTSYYHLGKATIGAVMGRDPSQPKLLYPDKEFLLHLEENLKRIIPPGATFLWIAVTECGRPVSAHQGYSIDSLIDQKERPKGSRPEPILNFKATGGCGLGGNTAIIPEVQEVLDRHFAKPRV